MHKRDQHGFAHLIIMIIIVLVVVVFAGLFVDAKREKGSNGSDSGNSIKNLFGMEDDIKFDVYPDTSDAPTLHLYWGEEKTAIIDENSLIEIEKFGVFENMPLPACETPKDPGAEWAVHFKTGSLPVYSYAPGTITNIQDEGVSKEVVVRYGRQYAVKYLHVTNVPDSLKQGYKVEAGTLVGYTQLLEANPDYEFWELEIDKIIDGKIARTDFPLNYFDDESQKAFEVLRESSGLASWFVDETSKEAGWLAYVGKPEAWADISKLGVTASGDDYCQFLKDYKLFE
ncbi:MAG: hypothetical protein Q7T41_00520 [Candidatus Saccharibacteria bacterium]|nr:hypothetical protein [Candidatus Saccharibacteria bacterium]